MCYYNIGDYMFNKDKILNRENLLIGIIIVSIAIVLILLFSAKKEEKITLTLKLVGEPEITLSINQPYSDKGCIAYDSKGINLNNYLRVNSNVDTTKAGIYHYTCYINYKGITDSKTRTINVVSELEFDLKILNQEYTNEDVIIKLEAQGTYYAYTILPNGERNNSRMINYSVSENGNYTFTVVDKNEKKIKKSIEVSNIDKMIVPFTCSATQTFDKLEIKVVGSDKESGTDYYIYPDNVKSKNNSYIYNGVLDNAKVKVWDKAGNNLEIKCNITKKQLEIHFITGVSDDDIILIRDNKKTIMIDGGQWNGRNKVVDYLQKIGVTHIDAMIGSHVHWNHVQAQAAILDNFSVDNLYYSVDILNCVNDGHCISRDVEHIKNKIIEQKKTPKILTVGDMLDFGDIKLYFIGPTRGKLTSYQNSNSLVFILVYGDKKFLFTGDTPSEYMNTTTLLTNAARFNMNIDVDFIKFPHHGYENLSDNLFKEMTPEYAISPNCCSCSSIYPTATNRNLLKKYNTTHYEICDSKNTVLLSDGNKIIVKTNENPLNYYR